ncbi:MAG: Arsenate reductase [Pseudomonadota bacterium]|jgi:arsenate reductase
MTPYNILFVCTGNSARSIMAEVLTNTLTKGKFKAYSAGSSPLGQVHPLALEKIQALPIELPALRSKSWEEFTGPDAPAMDFVITVCDTARGETCPVWPGQPISAHWGFEDPVKAEGTEAERRRVFHNVWVGMTKRIELLMNLPVESLDRDSLRNRLQDVHQQAV